jgi:hypothetical protein
MYIYISLPYTHSYLPELLPVIIDRIKSASTSDGDMKIALKAMADLLQVRVEWFIVLQCVVYWIMSIKTICTHTYTLTHRPLAAWILLNASRNSCLFSFACWIEDFPLPCATRCSRCLES